MTAAPDAEVLAAQASITRPKTPLLRRSEAAAYVKAVWGFPCATRTLAKLAVIGGGPTFRRDGPDSAVPNR